MDISQSKLLFNRTIFFLLQYYFISFEIYLKPYIYGRNNTMVNIVMITMLYTN